MENDEVVFVESRNPLIEKYETYCSERNVDPWNCDKHRVNSFINFAYGNLKFKRPDIKNAVAEIEKKHKFKNLSVDPMIKRWSPLYNLKKMFFIQYLNYNCAK